jgi:hypothetical protein
MPDFARGQADRTHIGNQVGQDIGLIGRRHDAQVQGQRLGGLGTRRVITVGRRIIGAVESRANVGRQQTEPAGVAGVTQLRGRLRQNLRVLTIIGVRRQRNGRVLRISGGFGPISYQSPKPLG